VSASPADYSRAARRKHADPATLYETAEGDLTPQELLRLADLLHARHGWKPTNCQRDRLIDDLLDAGTRPNRIVTAGVISADTLTRRIAATRTATREVGPMQRLNKRGLVRKTGVRRESISNIPVTSQKCAYLDATSGANVEAEREFWRRIRRS
jgi:hypothetical protein